MAKKNLTDSLKVKSPCSQDWNAMKGSDKVRFCEHCSLSVNNISELTRKQALRLARQSDGEICVRYLKNPRTSSPVFADKLYQIVRRAGIAASVLSASLAVSTSAYAQSQTSNPDDSKVPVLRINQSEYFDPAAKNDDKNQTGSAEISGTVTDTASAIIPAAVVSLINQETNETRIATSNNEGIYEFKNVAPGNYRIKFTAEYFQTQEISDVPIESENVIKKDVNLAVASQMMVAGGIGFVDYERPLHRAVSEENIDEVKSLIAKGANVNAKDKHYNGITALFVAVEDGNLEMVETLLNFGAKVNAQDDEKRTPLMNLDDDATSELVQLLLNFGAKVNAVDKKGNSALIAVSNQTDAKILQVLLNHGAKVNAQNKNGQTALMNAAEADNLENVRILLAAGADVNLKNSGDETAWSLASDGEIKELLKSYGASVETETQLQQ